MATTALRLAISGLIVLLVWVSTDPYYRGQITHRLRTPHDDVAPRQARPVYKTDRKFKFLIAGVQKAGTTALDSYLRTNPHLAFPPIKEIHFFNNGDEAFWTRPEYDKYDEILADANATQIGGESTPDYTFHPRALGRIRAYNPEMRIIMLVRDPVQRAWSQWKMQTGRDAETEPFGWAIREGRQRLVDAAVIPGYHMVYSYVERGFYGAQYEALLQHFPAEQILLLQTEELHRDIQQVLSRVANFLGVPAEFSVADEKVFTTVLPELPDYPPAEDAKYLRKLYRQDIQIFQQLSGLGVPHWLGAK